MPQRHSHALLFKHAHPGAASVAARARTRVSLALLERVAVDERQLPAPRLRVKRAAERVAKLYGRARQVHHAVLPPHAAGRQLEALGNRGRRVVGAALRRERCKVVCGAAGCCAEAAHKGTAVHAERVHRCVHLV